MNTIIYSQHVVEYYKVQIMKVMGGKFYENRNDLK